MPSFAPIAVVGRACVLPGALTPDELWQAVVSGRDLVTSVPEGRWQVPRDQVLCDSDEDTSDRSSCDRGGYVRGPEGVFDPTDFAVAPDRPLVRLGLPLPQAEAVVVPPSQRHRIAVEQVDVDHPGVIYYRVVVFPESRESQPRG